MAQLRLAVRADKCPVLGKNLEGWPIEALDQDQEPPASGDEQGDEDEMVDRQEKITFAEMRESDVRGLLVYCADYRCNHSIAIVRDKWS